MAIRIVGLRSDRYEPMSEGRAPALYVMVMAHGRAAKVGALESAENAPGRLRQVEQKQRRRVPDPAGYPMRLAILGELLGLNLGHYRWQDDRWIYDDKDAFDQRWTEVEHLESALRLVLARRLGRLSPWVDWILVDGPPLSEDAWESQFRSAWLEVDQLGRPAPSE